MAEFPIKDIVAFITYDFILIHVHHPDKGFIHLDNVIISIYYTHSISSNLEDQVDLCFAFRQCNFSFFSLGDVTGSRKCAHDFSCLVLVDRSVVGNHGLGFVLCFHDQLVIPNLSGFKGQHGTFVCFIRICEIISKWGSYQLVPSSACSPYRCLVHIHDNPFMIKGDQRIKAYLDQSTIVTLKIMNFFFSLLVLCDIFKILYNPNKFAVLL